MLLRAWAYEESQFYTSTQERKQHNPIGIETGPLAQLSRFLHEFLGPTAVAAIQVDRCEAVIAREDQLRLSDPLSQHECLSIRILRLLELAAALMDLRNHDQRDGEVIELSQLAVECRGGLCRLKAFGFAAIRECAIGGRQVRVDI